MYPIPIVVQATNWTLCWVPNRGGLRFHLRDAREPSQQLRPGTSFWVSFRVRNWAEGTITSFLVIAKRQVISRNFRHNKPFEGYGYQASSSAITLS